jgi:nucleoside-diphosphate-sugar epimerase
MELSSGTQLYDFIYIDDAIEAITLIGEKSAPNKTYNLSSGNSKMLREFLIEIFEFYRVENYLSYFGKIGINGKALEEEVLSIKALTSDLGFLPKTKFIDGVIKLYNHTYHA